MINLEQKKKNDQLLFNIQNNNLNMVKHCIENGAEIDGNDNLPLIRAASFGHLEIVKYLIEKGADIHTQNETPLFQSIRRNHFEVMKYLIEIGANIHEENDRATILAASVGNIDMMRFLVEKGANDMPAHNAPLIYGVKSGHLNVVKYFVMERHLDIQLAFNIVSSWENEPMINWCKNFMDSQILHDKLKEDLSCKDKKVNIKKV